MERDSYLHIDLDILERNLELLREQWGSCEILAILKANAYGHGAQVMLKALEEAGIEYFGVAYLNEALELRKISNSDILILSPSPLERYEKIIGEDLIQSISSFEEGLALIEAGRVLSRQPRAEIKLDTGFHRHGFSDSDKSLLEIEELYNRGLKLLGLYSHFRLASNDKDREQFSRFMDFNGKLCGRGINLKLHMADSIASLDYPEYRLDRIRPGALIYGLNSPTCQLDIRPIASLKTRICRLKELKQGQGLGYDESWTAARDSLVGILPLGYGDGLFRSLSNKGYVIVKGQKAPMIGLMNMDSLAVDLTGIDEVELGEKVLVFGPGGAGEMTPAIMADMLGTNKNEILARIQSRLPRYYTKRGRSLYYDGFLDERRGDLFK